MNDYTELVKKLRETESRSKRQLLDEAADAIEQLTGERNGESDESDGEMWYG